MPQTRPFLRTAGRVTLTLGAIALAGAGVVGGQTVLAARLSAEGGPPPAPATSVAVARATLQGDYAVARRFAGQFEPRQETALAFEAGGTVAEILAQEGDRIAEGEVVARLDTRLLEAERDRLAASRAALDAQVELARRTDARQAELRTRGFATDQAVDDTSLTLMRLEAGLAEVDAALAAVDVRLSKAVLRAPFAGRVGRRALDAGAVAGAGAPVLTLLQDGPVLFRAGLDPALAEGLAPGDAATLDVGGREMRARLARLVPELEAATRARPAFFEVQGAAPPSRASGEVVLTARLAAPRPGAWVPLAALRQGPRGTWQVVTVEDGPDGPVAGLAAVEILHAEAGRAFVSGTLRDGAAFVPAGTHRVVPGERVRVVEGEAVAWAR